MLQFYVPEVKSVEQVRRTALPFGATGLSAFPFRLKRRWTKAAKKEFDEFEEKLLEEGRRRKEEIVSSPVQYEE